MNKFLKKVAVFIFILICFLLTKKFFTPYYLGDRTIFAKYSEISENFEKYNTIVFGSSRLYRHINSQLFDSLLQDKNFSTYNFAAPGTFNPATYYLYEKMMKSSHFKSVDHAFMELQSLSHYSKSNCTTTKASYWNSSKFLFFSLNYIDQSNYSNEEKRDLYSCYLKSYLFGFYDFSLFINLIRPISSSEMGESGYISLEKAMYVMRENRDLKNRWNDFHSDTSVLKDRIEAATMAASSTSKKNDINTYHLNYLNSLIEKSRNRGIKLVFILPPRLNESQYDELIPIAKALPQNNVIELYNYSKYSDLYKAEYSFDIGHLNTEGADLFTKYLAEEVAKLKSD